MLALSAVPLAQRVRAHLRKPRLGKEARTPYCSICGCTRWLAPILQYQCSFNGIVTRVAEIERAPAIAATSKRDAPCADVGRPARRARCAATCRAAGGRRRRGWRL